MHNDGKKYEAFVRKLQQALLDSVNIVPNKTITVELNKKIKDNFGILREFDIYWEYELAGISYKTVIECKDYASKISIEKIDALIGKIRDIPSIRAIYATKTGYQSGELLSKLVYGCFHCNLLATLFLSYSILKWYTYNNIGKQPITS